MLVLNGLVICIMLEKNNINILEVSRAYYPSIGGLEKFVSDRLKLYQHLGFNYELLTTDYSSGKREKDFLQQNVTFLKQYTPYNICFGVDEIIRGSNSNIISVNQFGNYLSDYSIYRGKQLGKKVVLTPHMYFHTSNYGLAKKIHQKLISQFLLKTVDAIICFTNYEKDFYQARFEVPEQKIFVIPHYYESRSTNYEINNDDYILYLGRSGYNKRLDLLIQAYCSIANYPYRLLLTVDISDLSMEIQELVKNNPRIELLGKVCEKTKYRLLASTRALILPSDYEAFGIVLLEASDFRKPLLCSRLPVFLDIVNSGGVVYFDNKVEDIKNALNTFQKFDGSFVSHMGNINKANLEKFSRSQIGSAYNNLFNQLFASKTFS